MITASNLPDDILSLVLEQLVDDSTALLSACLVSHSWYYLGMPQLLRHVDLSCHNAGRLHDYENDTFLREVWSDFHDDYRPANLFYRHRAFVQLMINRPGFAKHVHSLKWTLVWADDEHNDLESIDRETWNVLGQLTNVSKLDLASLHNIRDEPYIRQNPSQLFPSITQLRLLGWMHRGLVTAIVSCLDAKKLHTLKLDYLQDEGVVPEGGPMTEELLGKYAPTLTGQNASDSPDLPNSEVSIAHQHGEPALVMPGPMALPLTLLSQHELHSLSNLEIRLAPFSGSIEGRKYPELARAIAAFLPKVRLTLKALTLIFGEDHRFYHSYVHRNWTLSPFQQVYRPTWIRVAALFLTQIVEALSQGAYPQLASVTVKGFKTLEAARDDPLMSTVVSPTFAAIQKCPFSHVDFTSRSHIDYRRPFISYN